MTDDQPLVPAPEALVDCLDPGMAAALAQLPVGWWWCGGVCSVSCHSSIGPDRAYIPQPILDAFGDGFHADIDQPSTLSEALLDCIKQAEAAIINPVPADGTFDQATGPFARAVVQSQHE